MSHVNSKQTLHRLYGRLLFFDGSVLRLLVPNTKPELIHRIWTNQEVCSHNKHLPKKRNTILLIYASVTYDQE